MKKPRNSLAVANLVIVRFLTKNLQIQLASKSEKTETFVNSPFLFFPLSGFLELNWESVFDTPKLMLIIVRNIS